jgi:hypothetical protein
MSVRVRQEVTREPARHDGLWGMGDCSMVILAVWFTL